MSSQIREALRAAAHGLPADAAARAPICTCGQPDCKTNALTAAAAQNDREAIDRIVDSLSDDHLLVMAELIILEALLQ